MPTKHPRLNVVLEPPTFRSIQQLAAHEGVSLSLKARDLIREATTSIMAYRLVYHPAVLAEDLPAINRNLQRRIVQAIEQRLTTEPAHYGAPLRYRLKGYWKLRVGDYRIVYQIMGHEVWILRIDHRKDVYALPIQRLSWRP